VVDDIRPSTLNEINAELQKVLFRFMNNISPRTWTDPRRLIYSPLDDLDVATTLFEGRDTRSRPEHLQIPFGYFTRDTTPAQGNTWDYARRPYWDWISSKARELPRAENQVRFTPAVFQYTLKIFDNRFGKMETLIDIMLHRGIAEFTRSYTYDSAVMQGPMPFRVDFGNPQYDRNPTLRDRSEGKGRLYSIVLPIEVSCALGVGAPVHRIEKIEYDLYYRKLGSSPYPPRPDPADKLGGVLIDSNTEIGDD
jgi:hypothetical protein